MGRVFRLHHRMAGQAAELHRLHHVDAFVCRGGKNDDVHGRRTDEDQHPVTCVRLVEVEHGEKRGSLAARSSAHLAPPEDGANRNQDQSGDEDKRQNQVCQDAEIRPTLETELLHREQAQDEYQARKRKRRTRQADHIVRNRRKEIPKHAVPRLPPSCRVFLDISEADLPMKFERSALHATHNRNLTRDHGNVHYCRQQSNFQVALRRVSSGSTA